MYILTPHSFFNQKYESVNIHILYTSLPPTHTFHLHSPPRPLNSSCHSPAITHANQLDTTNHFAQTFMSQMSVDWFYTAIGRCTKKSLSKVIGGLQENDASVSHEGDQSQLNTS